jgi:hypothetical protein
LLALSANGFLTEGQELFGEEEGVGRGERDLGFARTQGDRALGE